MLDQKDIIENLFRTEYGKMVAVLLNKFGPSHLEHIEDAVQDALLKAMQVWGYKKLPDNPTAWLLRVASNGLIDRLRRDHKVVLEESNSDLLQDKKELQKEISLSNTISDSQLKMIFACCHPSLSKDYQITLSLKLIGGFGNGEIAVAMLKKEETVAKSFTRAKKQLKRKISTLDIPLEIGLQSRLAVVLKVIYLLFSEGYSPNSGASIIKKDICLEAIRLALLLSENKYCDHPNVHALIALMCFHTSRFEARVDENQELVDLEHQDREKFDRDLIFIGIQHLEKASIAVQSPSSYHMEAVVSYYHCIAQSFEKTDWPAILHLYDLQLQRQYSPIVQLNRIVPYYKVHGAKAAMQELLEFKKSPYCVQNALFQAIRAELLIDLKVPREAKEALKNAIAQTKNKLEQKHLKKKLRQLVREVG
jgi:RNA polymerase sigma-70 factor (ECF subfamily)